MLTAPHTQDQLSRIIARKRGIGSVPIALYGAGRTARDLDPAGVARPGEIVGIIDDDPTKHGCECAGLPVIAPEDAIAQGVRTVVITAEGALQDAMWAKRRRFLEAGAQVVCVPARFEEKGWDECLIDHYEYRLATARGLSPVYIHEYPPRDAQPAPALLDPLLRTVGEGDTVCEIGTGNGMWTDRIVARAARYYAVDYSARLLHEVIEHRFAQHLDTLTCVHDETASLAGVPDGSVGVVFSYDVFVHFKPDLVHQFLIAIERVLKPDGVALIHFTQWNDAAIGVWEKWHAESRNGGTSVMHYNHIDGLRASAARLGMSAEPIEGVAPHHLLVEFRKVS